jgi:hypothetical protein
MKMCRAAALLLLFVPVPFTSLPSQPMSMNGRVVAQNGGKPMAGAFVVVRDYQQLDQSYVSSKWESRTAADGSFSFAIETGCFDVLVSANGQFLPFAQRVCIRDQGNSVLMIKLKSDPHPVLLQR